MYKFNWEKYCKGKASHGSIPLKEKASLDGKEVSFGKESIWGTCEGQTVFIDWCDFIPDAPSTFMVFDRETYLRAGGRCDGADWADNNYGKIMEFKSGSDEARSHCYGFSRKWCRPLTLDDFKREKIAVTFSTEAEQKRFLQECEKAGLFWAGGRKATEGPRGSLEYDYPITANGPHSKNPSLAFWSKGAAGAKEDGYTIVPFSSFSFPAEPPKPIPSRSIHITSDGLTTHAVMKEGEKVVKRSKATCSPTDQYDFQTGAEMALERLFPASKAVTPAPREHMWIKRKAKAGEKIKVVKAYIARGYYKNGDVLSVKCDHDSNSVYVTEFSGNVVLLPVRRVHRRAMPGEWVEIVHPAPASPYKNGDILKIVPSIPGLHVPGRARYGDKSGQWFDDDEYDVLEGYEEGAKWPEK